MHRLLFGLCVSALAAPPASAQDWAQARLEKSPRHGEWVKVKHGDREVQAFIVYPEVKEKAVAVVVIAHRRLGSDSWQPLRPRAAAGLTSS
jgi:carboxymethylenebutenolidase